MNRAARMDVFVLKLSGSAPEVNSPNDACFFRPKRSAQRKDGRRVCAGRGCVQRPARGISLSPATWAPHDVPLPSRLAMRACAYAPRAPTYAYEVAISRTSRAGLSLTSAFELCSHILLWNLGGADGPAYFLDMTYVCPLMRPPTNMLCRARSTSPHDIYGRPSADYWYLGPVLLRPVLLSASGNRASSLWLITASTAAYPGARPFCSS